MASMPIPIVSVRSTTGTATRDAFNFCSKRVTAVPVAVSVDSDAEAARRRRRRRNLTVKATGPGAAKYKGTRMKEEQLTEMIERKVTEAKQVCEGDERSDECKVAWDEVEEVSQAKADLRRRLEKQDPLEFYCQDNPETEECRIYED